MKCARVKEKLYLFVGDDLPWWQRQVVSRHLRLCDSCQAARARIEKTRQLLVEALTSQPVSESKLDCWAGVEARIRERRPSNRSILDWRSGLGSRVQRKVYAGLAFGLFVLALIGGAKVAGLFDGKLSSSSWLDAGASPAYPVIEDVNMANVTVMTYDMGDPKIKIVWFFKEESDGIN